MRYGQQMLVGYKLLLQSNLCDFIMCEHYRFCLAFIGTQNSFNECIGQLINKFTYTQYVLIFTHTVFLIRISPHSLSKFCPSLEDQISS